ncbi:hypothetical protein Nmel_016947 [Mimus melanotis]
MRSLCSRERREPPPCLGQAAPQSRHQDVKPELPAAPEAPASLPSNTKPTQCRS